MPRYSRQRRHEIRYRRRRVRRSLNLLLLGDDHMAPEELEDWAELAVADYVRERDLREFTHRLADESEG